MRTRSTRRSTWILSSPIDLQENGALSPAWPLAYLGLLPRARLRRPQRGGDDPGRRPWLTIAHAFEEAAVARKAARLLAEDVVWTP